LKFIQLIVGMQGPSWPWLHGSWIYNCQCNQCLSPLTLRVRIPLSRGVLDTTLCDIVCQWLATVRFSPGTTVSSTKKTSLHEITEILLKVVLNTITITLTYEIFDLPDTISKKNYKANFTVRLKKYIMLTI